MTDISEILNIPPYSLNKTEKHELLTKTLGDLTQYHNKKCDPYKRILESIGFNTQNIKSYYDIPFLPVRLFKDMKLVSVKAEDVVKTMTSSGTTGETVSQIFVDKETAANQQKTLVKIVSSFLGSKRMPMIILDTSAILKDRAMFSARGAGILGFSIFASDRIYALNDDMELDLVGISEFLEKHKGKKIFLFGFTFMVWQHFYKELVKNNITLDLSQGILIHGGGWKKLLEQKVPPLEFKNRLRDICGISEVYDYYGMVEQTGSIYMECEYGHLHAPIFSDVIIRNSKNFSSAAIGQKGIIQVVSILPKSYPGHSILTEDEGTIIGEDTCPCGRLGKYFEISGRIKNAELRGCSDTYASKFR